MTFNPTAMDDFDPAQDAPAIAIVGMAGRFPGIEDLDGLWSLLEAGGTTLESVDRETLLSSGRSEAELASPGFVPVGGHMHDVRRFDAGFFGYTPREAAFMDPQLRAMLETAWHVFEDAGIDPARGGERTGVFAGMKISSYLLKNLPAELARGGINIETLCLTMNGQDYVSTWIAYKLGLTGPAMNVQTACSSGLSTVVVACQHLVDRSCDAALAIAGAITVPQHRGYVAEADSIVSTDGVCRPFDARANGTVFSDGVAGILLKRLDDACAAGDRIVAVIRGFALNNDGQRKVSYSAPSVDGQAEVIAEALAMSGLEPRDIDFVEAHGTGTHLGDPIEFAAIDRIYGVNGRESPCRLGALKASIGHTAECAGMAGLIKAAMSIERQRILPHPTFREPNPHIDLRDGRFRIATRVEDWPRPSARRRAAVSSLGFGGTNSHVVLEQAPDPAERPDAIGEADAPLVLTLSARSPASLDALRGRYGALLAGRDAPALRDLCLNVRRCRAAMPWRIAASGADPAALRRALAAQAVPQAPVPPAPRLALVFGGHGIENLHGVRALAGHDPVFRDGIEAGLAALGDKAAPVRALLLDGGDLLKAEASSVQSALVIQGCAASRAWRGRGFDPALVLGHSLGEIAAAETAGLLDLKDAVALAHARGAAMQRHAPVGAMLALNLPRAEAEILIAEQAGEGCLVLSGVNGERQCVASGDGDAIARLADVCAERGLTHRRLPVSFPFHSPLMKAAADAFAPSARAVAFGVARIPLVSSLTGALDQGRMADSAYWSGQVLAPVRFREAVLAAEAQGVTAFLELSARPLYAFAARATLDGAASRASWITAFGADEPAPEAAARARAQLFCVGFAGAELEEPRQRVRLPLYPFAETRYWIEAPRSDVTGAASRGEFIVETSPAATVLSEESEPDALLQELAAIWQERIGGRVGPDDDFFTLGGSSLVALSVLSDIEHALGVRPPLASFLEARTVRGLGSLIERFLAGAPEGDTDPASQRAA